MEVSMLKKSAGILVYKIEDNIPKVLLSHFGGPFWEGIDKGGWSIPKGELTHDEKILDAAKREFKEETNLDIDSKLHYLGSKKVSHKKLAIIFYALKDFDLGKCKSNTFKLEYPNGSGKYCNFPEMDTYEWMDIPKAKEMIIANQLYFINKFEDVLNGYK